MPVSARHESGSGRRPDHSSLLVHRLDLLGKLFEEVLLPPAVRDEVLAAPPGTLGLDEIQAALAQGWLKVQEPRAPGVEALSALGGTGPGETQAISLAGERAANLFVTDDLAARRLGLVPK